MATDAVQQTEGIPSVKDLASSEPSLRRKNLDEIITHLESRSSSSHLTPTQALQIWRGFHVALYMHDSKNQLSVQKLIATLASTLVIIRNKDIELAQSRPNSASEGQAINEEASKNDDDEFTGFDDEATTKGDTVAQPATSWLAIYTTAFWETIAREWSSIDQWRINKYLLLVRFVLRELFTICLSSHFGVEDTTTSTSSSPTDKVSQSSPSQPSSTSSKKRKTPSDPSLPSTTTPKKSKPITASKPAPSSPTRIPIPSPTPTVLHLLTTHPLSPRSRSTPDGLRLHMLDIYIDELFTALKSILEHLTPAQKSDEARDEIESVFLAPVRGIAESSAGAARPVRSRAKETLGEFGPRWTEDVL